MTRSDAKSLLERLEDKFLVADDCWPWTAARYPNGYGHLNHLGKDLLAHVVLYELLVQPVPDGLELDHLCRNRACCRPDHLEPVTRRENVRRGALGSKTHCKHGHSLEDALIHHGRRECRECNRLRCRRRTD